MPLALAPAWAQPRGPVTAEVSACFTPVQSSVGDIVAAIDAAHAQMRVHAYGHLGQHLCHRIERPVPLVPPPRPGVDGE